MLRLLAGILAPAKGRVFLGGLDLASIRYVVVNRALATPGMLDFVAHQMPLALVGHDQQFDLMVVRDGC